METGIERRHCDTAEGELTLRATLAANREPLAFRH